MRLFNSTPSIMNYRGTVLFVFTYFTFSYSFDFRWLIRLVLILSKREKCHTILKFLSVYLQTRAVISTTLGNLVLLDTHPPSNTWTFSICFILKFQNLVKYILHNSRACIPTASKLWHHQFDRLCPYSNSTNVWIMGLEYMVVIFFI